MTFLVDDADRLTEVGTTVLVGFLLKMYIFIKNCFEILPRQALHAKTLGFIHPNSGEEIKHESEIPEDLAAVLEKWKTFTSAQRK